MTYAVRKSDKNKRQSRKSKEPHPPVLPKGRHYGAFRHAIKVANNSNCPNKHGAVVTMGGSIIAASSNRLRHDARWVEGSCSVHAETGAIKASKVPYWRHKPSIEVYVVRINDHGSLRMSAPCLACQKFLRTMNVRRVFYSTGEGFDSIAL